MRPFEELAGEARDAKALTFVRKNAIHELAKSSDARALDVLEELLGDAQAAIRRETVTALGGVEGSRATQLIVRTLDDNDRQCVKAALTQLGRREDPSVIPVLKQLKEKGDLSLRIEADRLLKQLGVDAELAEGAEEPPEREPEPAPEPEPRRPRREEPPVPPPPPRAPVAPSREPEVEEAEIEEPHVEVVPPVPVAPRAQAPRTPPPPPNIPHRRLSRRERDRLTPGQAYRVSGAPGRGQSKQQGCSVTASAFFIVISVFVFFLILIGRCV